MCGFLPLSPPGECFIDKWPIIHFKEKINQLPPLNPTFSAHPVRDSNGKSVDGQQSLKGVWTDQWPLRHQRAHHSLILSWRRRPQEVHRGLHEDPVSAAKNRHGAARPDTPGTGDPGERHTAGVRTYGIHFKILNFHLELHEDRMYHIILHFIHKLFSQIIPQMFPWDSTFPREFFRTLFLSFF